MANQRPFGRRANPQRETARAPDGFDPVPRSAKPAEVPPDQASLGQGEMASLQLDHELAEWKQARRQRFKIPWRQLSLMAALCFGIASLVLPDSVNENLEWLLYGLMAASLCASLGLRRGR